MGHEPAAAQGRATALDQTTLPRYVPVGMVAEVLGTHVNTVKRWVASGDLPIRVVRIGGRPEVRYCLDDLLAWLEAGQPAAPAATPPEPPARRPLAPVTPAVRRMT